MFMINDDLLIEWILTITMKYLLQFPRTLQEQGHIRDQFRQMKNLQLRFGKYIEV
jgi:hypothetical protein